MIIGSRLSSAESLVELWGGNDEHRNKKLAAHPIQSKIILESLYQLRYFYDYAAELSENTADQELAEKYKNIAFSYGETYNLFYDIYQSKEESIQNHGKEVKDDIVFQTIAEYTGNNNE